MILQTVFVFLVFFDRLAVKLELRVVAHNRQELRKDGTRGQLMKNLQQRVKFGQKVLLISIMFFIVLFMGLGFLTDFSLETPRTP